jgi:hypothetical protein
MRIEGDDTSVHEQEIHGRRPQHQDDRCRSRKKDRCPTDQHTPFHAYPFPW